MLEQMTKGRRQCRFSGNIKRRLSFRAYHGFLCTGFITDADYLLYYTTVVYGKH